MEKEIKNHEDVSELAQEVLDCVSLLKNAKNSTPSYDKKTHTILDELISQNQTFFVFLDELNRFSERWEDVDYEKDIEPIINNCDEVKKFFSEKN